MEGVEFQLRTKRPSSSRDYPLTFDQRVQEGDRFRLSEAKLTNTLKAIEQNFASEKSGPPHTGKPDCQRCGEKKRQIWQAYFEYYLGNEVGRWDSGLSSYREEMQIMMNSIPDRCTLGDVHARFEHELREHLKKDLSTPDQNLDTVDLAELKRLTMEQFDRGTPTQEILEGRLNAELKSPALHSSDAIAFMTALQRSKTSHDRIQIYIKYYCTPLWNDTPQQKSIKSRFARHFESGMSHDAVLGMWKKEALESQNVEIGKLKKEMGDLQMAQSAHLREKLKKAEKDQKMEDVAADYVHVQKQTAKCLLERCERDINLTEGEVLECALCDWLASKDRSERRNHAYYCCEQHVEEDFEYHDRNDHSCSMSSYCIFEPETGPEETGQGGICPDCMDNGILSYFCSQDCYKANLESHIEDDHYPKGIHGRTGFLETFRPASDLEIVSS